MALMVKHAIDRLNALDNPPSERETSHYRLYRPEFCQRAVALGREGKTMVQMASDFGIAIRTLHAWRFKYPDFDDAVAVAITHSEAWWYEWLKTNSILPKDLKMAQMIPILLMKNAFGWRDQVEHHHDGEITHRLTPAKEAWEMRLKALPTGGVDAIEAEYVEIGKPKPIVRGDVHGKPENEAQSGPSAQGIDSTDSG